MAIVALLLVLFEVGIGLAIPLEITISQRQSIREFTTETVSSQQLLSILRASYGSNGNGRVLPRVGDEYSLVVFAVNGTGSYRFVPETNSLDVQNTLVNKDTIRPHDSDWPSNADVVLVIVWDQTRMNNQYFASAEAGCLVQNVHLAALSQNLGTCCVGGIDSAGLRNDLRLSSTMVPILVMPIGHPSSPYPNATPDYRLMSGNLPIVQNISKSFADALESLNYTQAWSTQNLSIQELSNVLWAAYGYSSSGHRTTPSAHGIYSLIVFMLNSTGAYRYVPESHSVLFIREGDRRSDVAVACGNQIWVAKAPSVFIVTLDSQYNDGNTGDGGVLEHEWIEVNAGCVVQQILLESSALSLSANLVAKGFESWNGTSAQTLREALNIPSSIVPLYIVPVGHVPTKSSSNINCQVSADSVKLSESLTIFGTISRTGASTGAIAGVPITLTYTKPYASTVNRTIISSVDGTFIEIYTPDALGDWSVKASWPGNYDTEGTTSDLVSFTVTTAEGGGPISTTISCSVSPTSVPLNGSLAVYGSISPAVSGATITLIYTKPDTSTTTRIVTSKSDGSFTSTYAPDVVGGWSVRSSWLGDASHKGSTSSVSAFTVTEEIQPPPKGGIPMEVVCALVLIIFVAVGAAVYFYIKRDKK